MSRYKIGCELPGKYRVALDSDAFEFGGHGRVRCIEINDFWVPCDFNICWYKNILFCFPFNSNEWLKENRSARWEDLGIE